MNAMADYFNDLGHEPTGPEGADISPHLRHLQVQAIMHGIDLEIDVPPASLEAISKLNVHKILASEVNAKLKCSICLEKAKEGDEYKILQCKHEFHENCIVMWLKKHNTCPLCRDELETDDKDYEELRRFRRDEPNRVQRQNNLLNDMYT